MTAQLRHQRVRAAGNQRGQAMLLLVLLIAVGAGAVIFTMATPARTAIVNDKKTAAALAQAKDALIGRAAADNTRPGSLPCPDVDNDGALTMGVDFGGGGICTSNIGRLPWRTLGLPDLRDGSGERLWYAVSSNFRDASGITINSDTAGQLTINGTAPANNVIAIIFAPGAVVGSQVRDMANQNDVSNYLEGENSNLPLDTTYTTGAASTTFNDQLMPITREVLFPVIELRVARELRLSLQNYYNAPDPPPSGTPRGYYPFAAPFPGTIAITGTYRGYVPTGATPACAPPTPDLSPFLPAWFVANNWQHYMVYAVAPRCTARIRINYQISILLSDPTPLCAVSCIPFGGSQICTLSQAVDPATLNCNNTFDGTPAGSWLTVSGTGNIRSVVMPASYALGAQPARPCAGIADCLEAVSGATPNENIDADNYVYVRPIRSVTNNDNLVIVGP